ncbi:MFS transporter, DHA2 family, multidrug resistance protein [Chitinophaga sp. YR627]|uniref:MFS transporter n=1 Tax=Chitinophaga sp. YR627 TaxID=1881041 RepID=UPI0008DF331F|nr:MFS transporter [Chitinophaga sp. YR627]SFN22745.1 MFS transporter, DHA2 family, multidrug resistance protein [Chitinophaga sp. YR627]
MERSASLAEYGVRRVFITLIAFICTLVAVMNITAANVAFNEMRGNIGASLDELSWITTAYVLAYIAIAPFCSWLSGKLGNKTYLTIALALFVVSSFLCGNATSITTLVVFRFLQGLGGGAMLVLSHIMILESWPRQRQTTAQAFFILGVLGGIKLAAPFCGYITDNYSWPYLFFANILVGILLCILVVVFVKNRPYKQREDWLGTIMFSIGAACLYLALVRGQEDAWLKSPFIIVLLLSGLVGLIVFIRSELQWINPQGENGLLRNVSLRNALIVAFVAALCVSASSFTMVLPPRLNAHLIHISPLLVILCITAIMALITFLIEEKNALKYVLSAGALLLVIYNCMVYRQPLENSTSSYIYSFLAAHILAIICLSVSVITLVFSKLEEKEIRQGIRMYHLVMLLGLALGFALFSASYKPPVTDQTGFSAQLDLKDPLVQHALKDGTRSLSEIRFLAAVNRAHDAQVGAGYVNLILFMITAAILLIGIPIVVHRMKNKAQKHKK